VYTSAGRVLDERTTLGVLFGETERNPNDESVNVIARNMLTAPFNAKTEANLAQNNESTVVSATNEAETSAEVDSIKMDGLTDSLVTSKLVIFANANSASLNARHQVDCVQNDESTAAATRIDLIKTTETNAEAASDEKVETFDSTVKNKLSTFTNAKTASKNLRRNPNKRASIAKALEERERAQQNLSPTSIFEKLEIDPSKDSPVHGKSVAAKFAKALPGMRNSMNSEIQQHTVVETTAAMSCQPLRNSPIISNQSATGHNENTSDAYGDRSFPSYSGATSQSSVSLQGCRPPGLPNQIGPFDDRKSPTFERMSPVQFAPFLSSSLSTVDSSSRLRAESPNSARSDAKPLRASPVYLSMFLQTACNVNLSWEQGQGDGPREGDMNLGLHSRHLG
jgi:hypothetical protein